MSIKFNWAGLLAGLLTAAPAIAESVHDTMTDANEGDKSAAALDAYQGLAATATALVPAALQPMTNIFVQMGALVTQGTIAALHSGTPASQVPGTTAAALAGNTASSLSTAAAVALPPVTTQPIGITEVHTPIATQQIAETDLSAQNYYATLPAVPLVAPVATVQPGAADANTKSGANVEGGAVPPSPQNVAGSLVPHQA